MSDQVVGKNLATANQLATMAGSLDISDSTSVSTLEDAPTGDYREFLAVYDGPQQESK